MLPGTIYASLSESNLAHRLSGDCTGGKWKHGPWAPRLLTIAGRLSGGNLAGRLGRGTWPLYGAEESM